MKQFSLITIGTLLTASILVFSCEKDNPTEPVNYDETTPPCSFCPTSVMELDGSNMISETYATQVAFQYYGTSFTNPGPFMSRTPNGYYSVGGRSIAFDFSALPLACVSNKITFSHARFAVNSNPYPSLVNVQFPGTPLIATTPDSLDYYLSPYGYHAEHYYQPTFVHMNTAGDGFAGVVDSVIITGPEFETVTIGANLFESELRNICVSHQ